MSIYFVPNIITGTLTYFVSDESTQLNGQNSGVDGNYVIGTLDDANALLTQNAQSYLAECADRFTVCRTLYTEDGLAFTAVNLDNEPQDPNVEYQVFNTLTGVHETALGTDVAKELLAKIKNDFIVWSGLSEVKTLEALPKRKVKSQGTQSL